MGFLSRLFGGGNDEDERDGAPRRRGGRANLSPDEQAVERYRYLLQTAPPETIEQAHAEAFERLTPEQRQMVLQELGNAVPENERATSDDPRAMARMATRAEMRQPGTMERTFSGIGGGGMGGIGMGGLMAGSFFSSFAGIMVGGAIANAFFNDSGYNDSGDSGDGGDSGDSGGDSGDSGGDAGDAGGYDSGGDFGGGDFGGGDFGGGDFGGGEF